MDLEVLEFHRDVGLLGREILNEKALTYTAGIFAVLPVLQSV